MKHCVRTNFVVQDVVRKFILCRT